MQSFLPRFAAAALLLSVAQIGLAGAPPGLPDNAAGSVSGSVSGTVTLVQAVPGRAVEMRVDGRELHRVAHVGEVIGPVRLPAGRHEFAFVGSGGNVVRANVSLRPGSSVDVVLHRPAAVRGASVVTSFPTPTRPIRAGWARILVAATASLVPADVRVDDRVVFANIANGESATIDVTAGRHLVALVPTGQPAPAVLGPLKVTVAAGTVTMVYAAGGPPAGAPRAIVHTMAWATVAEPPPAVCTPGRLGWPATSPFGCLARDDAMIRHRTFTSLLLAAAAGAVLAVLLGLLTPGPADPVSSRGAPVAAAAERPGGSGPCGLHRPGRAARRTRQSAVRRLVARQLPCRGPVREDPPGRPHRLATPAAGTLRRTVRCATRAPASAAVGRPSSGLPHPLGAAGPRGSP